MWSPQLHKGLDYTKSPLIRHEGPAESRENVIIDHQFDGKPKINAQLFGSSVSVL